MNQSTFLPGVLIQVIDVYADNWSTIRLTCLNNTEGIVKWI